MTEGFEVDRGASGRVRINVVSVANLLALIALIATAIATWNELASKVEILSVRVEGATSTAGQLRSELNTSVIARDVANRDLSLKVENIGNRLSVVETVLNRVERKLEKN